MDETPEELEQIRREADKIDVNHYKKRFRALKAIALGALAAGAVELTFVMVDSRRNPCERVRNHFCRQDPKGMQCQTYAGILDESLHDDSKAMRANIKAQCQSKIDRLKEEDNVEVK
jgi:hypothetical protein